MKFMKIKLLVIALIMFAASSAFASLSYDVNVDTSGLTGTSGYLYLQYNTGMINNSGTTTATVSNFTTDGTLGATAPGAFSNSGQYVTGTLPATVTFTSGNLATNDYNQAITFGSNLNFNLLLPNGATQNQGTTFVVSLFQDPLGATPLKTSDGNLLLISLNTDGTASVTAEDPGTTATPTPIPAAAWLLGSGLMGLAGIRRRKE